MESPPEPGLPYEPTGRALDVVRAADERTMSNRLDALVELLSAEGFVAAGEEAEELLSRAGGDLSLLGSLVARRLTGEPLAWITGRSSFCGLQIRVDPGVYVPRWQSEPLARRAAERLPPDGVAIDICTGSGAIAKALAAERPGARIVATDADERAVACARANGVECHLGDLFAPLPRSWEGRADVVVGVLPYVPTAALDLLARDTLSFESALSYDGGPDGVLVLRRVVTDSPRFLKRGGALLLELGGEQGDVLAEDLALLGYVDSEILVDDEGDVRGIEATLGSRAKD
jgi:release factor glutamine methyltransferase